MDSELMTHPLGTSRDQPAKTTYEASIRAYNQTILTQEALADLEIMMRDELELLKKEVARLQSLVVLLSNKTNRTTRKKRLK